MSVQAITHVGLCVSDLERSRVFYRDLLGFEERTKLAIDGGTSEQLLEVEDLKLRCIFLERDGLRIELMHYGAATTGDGRVTPIFQRGLTHFALRVDDLDDMVTRLEAGGAEILRHTEIRNDDFGARVVFAVDPDGVRLELIQSPGNPMALLGEPL